MSVDKFGRISRAKPTGVRGPPGIGFLLTKTGDFNLQLKRLTNVEEPVEKFDVTTKQYVDGKIEHLLENIREINAKLNGLDIIHIKQLNNINDTAQKLEYTVSSHDDNIREDSDRRSEKTFSK